MTINNQIHFIVYHYEAGEQIIDLDVSINHAENLICGKLVYVLMQFTQSLKSKGYGFKLWKEGEDK